MSFSTRAAVEPQICSVVVDFVVAVVVVVIVFVVVVVVVDAEWVELLKLS